MKKIFDRVSHWKDRPKSGFAPGSGDSSRSAAEVDISPQTILAAARALVEGIEDILSDQGSLSGDMSGFHRLLVILQSEIVSEEINAIASSRGNGCLALLIGYTSHSSFVDMCTQATLAPALMHSLRLLRMMEVKNGSANVLTESASPRGASTAIASERVCIVLVALCAQNVTLEQLRPSLTKLLQLPLSPLPESGIHFQEHVASVVFSLCKSALSSQIVWCLRDTQAIAVMVKSLRELTALEANGGPGSGSRRPSQVQQDILLRGKAAEQKGMWIIATSCLVQLLNASDAFSPVLMTEFEAAHGYDLLVHIVVHSGRDRGMKIMNVITELLVGGSKDAEKPLMHPPVGAVFTGILKAVLRLEKSLRSSWTEGDGIFSGNESVDDMRRVAMRLARKAEEWNKAEYILQNFSYTLLTLYSSHAENYHILEPKYHFLPIVTLCLPTFRVVESSFAVLKTIDFVCSEGLGSFPMMALCASIAVMVQQCVSADDTEDVSKTDGSSSTPFSDTTATSSPAVTPKNTSTPDKKALGDSVDEPALHTPKLSTSVDEKKRASKRLQQSLQYLEDITTREERYAFVFAKEGLKVVLCDHLSRAENYPEFNATEAAIKVFNKLLRIVVNTISVHPTVSNDVRESGLFQLASTLIACPGVNSDFAHSLLVLLEKFTLTERDRFETNVERLMDTLRLVRGDLEKMTHVMDCLSRVLQHGHDKVSEVWQMVDGFSALLSVISSLEGSFSPRQDCEEEEDEQGALQTFESDPLEDKADVSDDNIRLEVQGDVLDEEHRTLLCLQSALRCLAWALTPRGPENTILSNRKYFREKIKYPALTGSLHRTGVFASTHSNTAVTSIFALVSGCDDSSNSAVGIANPDAMAVVIDIIPLLSEKTAYRTIHLITDHAFGQIDGCQLLSEAGIMRLLVEKFQSVLRDSRHPLKIPMSSLLLTLCGEYLTIVDFAAFLRNLVRPDAILSQKTQKLLPLWEAVEKKGIMAAREWDSVQMLIDLMESSSSRSHGVPYASLGQRASKRSGEDPAHIRIHWSEQSLGRVFPVGNFSFSCWVQMGDSIRRPSIDRIPSQSVEDRRAGMLPVFSLRGASGGVFEVQFDVLESVARIVLQTRGKPAETMTFGVPYINENEWHLVVVTIKKPKRVVTAAKVTVSLYFDGQAIFTEKLDHDIPIQGPSIDMYIGRTMVSNQKGAIERKGTGDTSPAKALRQRTSSFDGSTSPSGKVELMKLWHVGPILFFDDCLSQVQVSCIMTKGPTYTGIFQGESPLEDALSTVVTDMLCKCNSTFLDMNVLMDSLGLKGMELIVIPLLEEYQDERVAIQIPGCPLPLLAYSASSVHTISADNAINKSPFRVTLHNSASDHPASSQAELVNGWHVSQVDSIARCIGALGGPAVLIPLAQAASSERQLLVALQLLKECCRSDSPNMKYMHTEGYGILSFLISRKPKDMITIEVVDSLFSWCVDRGLKSSNSSVFSILLVDTLAMHHFILNHQIWSICRPMFASHVMDLLRSLVCEDARHAVLNAERLGRLGLVKWILSLVSFGMDRSVAVANESADTAEPDFRTTEWTTACRTIIECAGSRDSKDHFISTSIYVLKVIMLCHLRQGEVSAIANSILRSLFGAAQVSAAPRRRTSSTASSQQAVPFEASPAEQVDEEVQLLSPVCTLRINLLRLLREVYILHMDSEDVHYSSFKAKSAVSDAETQSIFSTTLTPRWFMVVLEKSTETATTAFCLRLLGTMLQKDGAFRRSFCAMDPELKSLRLILTPDDATPPPLPVALPLLALLFQIPMKYVPLPSDAAPQLMIEIMQKCPGPAIQEPDLSEFTLPMFSIVMTCFWQAARHGSSAVVREQNVVISAMISQAMVASTFDTFRTLMHNRVAVETVACALLMCSNACDDYGSHIYSTSSDLSSSIQEDYINVDYGDSVGEVSAPTSPERPELKRYRAISDPAVVFTWSEVRLVSPEGDEMGELLFKMIRNAVTSFHSPHTVAYFFLAFPKHMTESFVCGYQVMLFNILKKVIRLVFEEMDVMALQAACSVFTLLIPLARARVIYDVVLLDMLIVAVNALETVSSMEVQNWLGIEKHLQIVKDIGASARIFAMLNMHSVLHTSDGWSRRLDTIRCIRSKLHLLCSAAFEEITDVNLVKNRKETDDRRSAIQVLEAYNISLFPTQEVSAAPVSVGAVISGKRVNAMDIALSMATTDKVRISQMFLLILFLNTHALFLDDEQCMRTEAMRVCAALLIHRRQQMFEILYPQGLQPQKSKRTIDAPEEFENVEASMYDGFMKLLPDTGAGNVYAQALKQINVESEGEEARMASFSFWLTDHRAQCDALTTVIDGSTTAILPSILSPAYSVREIISEKTKYDALYGEEVAHTFWTEEFNLHIELCVNRNKVWLVYGFSDIAKGSVSWKDVWVSLQSSPVWGIKPVVRTDNSTTDDHDTSEEANAVLTFTPLTVNTEEAATVPWRLDFAEGPEKMRIRLEQDYNEEMTGGHEEVDADTTAGDGEREESDADNSVDNVDMEEFFKRMSQSYRRKGIVGVDDGEGQFADIEAMIEGQGLEDDNSDLGEEEEDEEEEDEEEEDEEAPGDLHKSLSYQSAVSPTDEGDGDDSSAPMSYKKRFSRRIISAAISLPVAVRAAVKGEEIFPPEITMSGSGPTEEPALISSKHYSTQIVRNDGLLNIGKQESRKEMILVELVRGIIGLSEWDAGYFVNISRISGLEARVALLIITPYNLHIIDGIQMQKDGPCKRLEWTEIVSQKASAASKAAKAVLSPAEVVASVGGVDSAPSKKKSSTGLKKAKSTAGEWAIDSEEEINWMTKVWFQMLHSEYGYYRMPVDQVYSIFKKRYQLEYVALEVTDVIGLNLHFACNSVNECEATLKRLLEIDMHQSLFHKVGMKNLQIAGGLFMYKRLMAYFLSNTTKLWQKGNISNLEYLMHLNAVAGRSFMDLTQYPVFPWVLADYESKVLNLQSSASFRDLSRPMGALGEKRALQYAERFRTMDEFYKDEVEGCTPPFFYGTHYSCAGYVLYYLMRMQPYSRMAISLQGGQFDKADRLFKGLEHSWFSASSENLQDVRELIPEFYFLPEFLRNSNHFNLGETQKGELVDDVQLPPWAAGDPIEFIRLHRQALESKYVSENLHNWIDLIFGCKQRGKASESAMNVFIPLTYEGEVKLEDITDPMLREATLAQINNFGQTPSRLFSKPHPKRQVPDAVRRTQDGYVVDTAGIQWLEHMTPPLCVVGAPSLVWMNRVASMQVLFPPPGGEHAPAVGDIRIVSRDRMIAVPDDCVFIPPKYVKFIRYGKTVGGISLHVAQSSPRHMEIDKEVSSHEQLHLRPVTCVTVSGDGETVVTGSSDRSVRVWRFSKQSGARTLEHLATLCGHDGSIVCLDICTAYSIVVSGSADRTAMVWDTRGAKLLRVLENHTGTVLSVSVNAISGNIATLTAGELRLYTINGELLSRVSMNDGQQVKNRARVVLCPPSGSWQDGIVAVTGHENGHVFLWKLKISIAEDEDGQRRVVRELVSYSLTKVHRADITVLRLCPSVVSKSPPVITRVFNGECMFELVVGDAEGAGSRWAPGKLEQLSPSELQQTLNHPNTTPSRLGIVAAT